MSIFRDIKNTSKRVSDVVKSGSASNSKHSYEDLELVRQYIDNPVANADNLGVRIKNKLEPGDVIGVSRGIYDHVAVYIGEDRVIHFVTNGFEFGQDNTVLESHITRFLKDHREFYVINFNKFNEGIRDVRSVAKFFENVTAIEFSKLSKTEYNLYSPQETVERAKMLLGRKDYDVFVNNCEHIAMWCKTGLRECNQHLTLPFRTYFRYE